MKQTFKLTIEKWKNSSLAKKISLIGLSTGLPMNNIQLVFFSVQETSVGESFSFTLLEWRTDSLCSVGSSHAKIHGTKR